MSNNSQQVILITGCSSGFGLLTAARLAAQGHFVYATMRDVSKQQPLLDEAAKRNTQVLVRPLDVTKVETISKVIKEIENHHGHIDVLINNAGFGLGGFFEDLTQEEIRQQMEVNFFGVQNVTREVLPLMRERRSGKIINVSSIAGRCASPALSAYNASKWALEAFSESLYYEISAFGLQVVLVEPGSYPTKIFKENAQYAKGFNDPKSPYFAFSQKLKGFVDSALHQSKKDPEDVAILIERVVNAKNPRLRYVSDFSSAMRIYITRFLPPSIYNHIFRKVIYGNCKHAV